MNKAERLIPSKEFLSLPTQKKKSQNGPKEKRHTYSISNLQSPHTVIWSHIPLRRQEELYNMLYYSPPFWPKNMEKKQMDLQWK